MNKLSIFIVTVAILSFGSVVYAAKNETGAQVQNQNQVKTQNAGEDSQLQVNTQEQESQGMPKGESPRSETAKENMSVVAQKIEELLTTKTTEGGIGEQVKQIAQEQTQAQDQIQTELAKVDSRGGLLKSLIGPNYQALKNMQKQREQNQLRIQQLEQMKNQLINLGEITMVQETIQALTEQDTALQDRIALEEQTGSLLGWLFKLFVSY
ncbi:MAG: hypothetical protein ABII08_01325 [Candidatus Beckwithbacteria bacterium]